MMYVAGLFNVPNKTSRVTQLDATTAVRDLKFKTWWSLEAEAATAESTLRYDNMHLPFESGLSNNSFGNDTGIDVVGPDYPYVVMSRTGTSEAKGRFDAQYKIGFVIPPTLIRKITGFQKHYELTATITIGEASTHALRTDDPQNNFRAITVNISKLAVEGIRYAVTTQLIRAGLDPVAVNVLRMFFRVLTPNLENRISGTISFYYDAGMEVFSQTTAVVSAGFNLEMMSRSVTARIEVEPKDDDIPEELAALYEEGPYTPPDFGSESSFEVIQSRVSDEAPTHVSSRWSGSRGSTQNHTHWSGKSDLGKALR